MRTSNLWPGAAGGPNRRLPASAIGGYPVAFGAVVAGGLRNGLIASGFSPAQADGIIANLSAVTPAQLAAANVGTLLKLFDPARARAVPPNPFPNVIDPVNGVIDLRRLKATFNNTFEVGYKGGLANDRMLLSMSLWREERENFITASQNVTPNVFFDPVTLRAFLTARLTPMVGAAPAAAVATIVANGAGAVPLGTVVPEAPNSLTDRNDVLFSYRNVEKKLNLWGTDVAVDVQATDMVGFSANYSRASKGVFKDIVAGVDTLRLNAPQHKAAFAFRLRDDRRGWGSELRTRYTDAFKVNSGVYVGWVPVNFMLDGMVSYRLAALAGSATLSLYGTNLLDNRVPTFVGVPDIGRMVMGRVAYTF